MKEFLQEVYAKLEAGEVESAKEMLAEKINELDGVATMDDKGNGGGEGGEDPLPGQGNNGPY